MERIESQIGGVRDGPLPTSCYDEQSEHEVTRGGWGSWNGETPVGEASPFGSRGWNGEGWGKGCGREVIGWGPSSLVSAPYQPLSPPGRLRLATQEEGSECNERPFRVPFSRLPKVVSLTEREGMREGTTLTHSDRSVSWFPLSSHSLLEVETVR